VGGKKKEAKKSNTFLHGKGGMVEKRLVKERLTKKEKKSPSGSLTGGKGTPKFPQRGGKKRTPNDRRREGGAREKTITNQRGKRAPWMFWGKKEGTPCSGKREEGNGVLRKDRTGEEEKNGFRVREKGGCFYGRGNKKSSHDKRGGEAWSIRGFEDMYQGGFIFGREGGKTTAIGSKRGDGGALLKKRSTFFGKARREIFITGVRREGVGE